jgi:hypothetical protein
MMTVPETFSNAKLSAVRNAISLWRSQSNDVRGLIKDVDPEILLSKVESALSNIKVAKVLRFDPYIICGYDPSENQISDALRVIFDPKASHGLGSLGLRALFDAIETDDVSLRAKLDAVKSSLDDDRFKAAIIREPHHEIGRVDIRIDIRTGDKKFLIFVENKKGRDPQEVGETPQTVRYQRILMDGEASGVVGFGIYLTPSGRPAASKLFVPLTCDRFAESLRRLLSATKTIVDDKASALILVYAFALTYAWTN